MLRLAPLDRAPAFTCARTTTVWPRAGAAAMLLGAARKGGTAAARTHMRWGRAGRGTKCWRCAARIWQLIAACHCWASEGANARAGAYLLSAQDNRTHLPATARFCIICGGRTKAGGVSGMAAVLQQRRQARKPRPAPRLCFSSSPPPQLTNAISAAVLWCVGWGGGEGVVIAERGGEGAMASQRQSSKLIAKLKTVIWSQHSTIGGWG
jgi:hypothetical protein